MKYALPLFALLVFSEASFASKAGCDGSYRDAANRTHTLKFLSEGDVNNTANGWGKVYIDGRERAHFRGDQVALYKIARKFIAENDRGDVVEGKISLRGLVTGDATLRRLHIPGVVELTNHPVKCWFEW